ncbi:S8 family serine peptidase [bacterium]|nr:S8 family serine peptidase [bacterium]
MKNTAVTILILTLTLTAIFAMNLGQQENFLPEFALGQLAFSPLSDAALRSIEDFAYTENATVHKVTRKLDIYLISWKPNIDDVLWNEAVRTGDVETRELLHRAAEPEVWALVRDLEATRLVKWACPNYYRYIAHAPNDPFCINSTATTPTDPVNQFDKYLIHCPEAWDIQRGNASILLAIVDSGTDIDHPDLTANIWVNPGEDLDGNNLVYDLADIDGADNDYNGYIDDLFGYDFVGGVTGEESTPPDQEDWNPDIHSDGDDGWGEPDPSVGNGTGGWMGSDVGVSHGTHCSGVSAAVMDNENMFAGVAGGGVKIMPVRVGNPEGSMTVTDIAAGIEYAAIAGANIISMSLGGMSSESEPVESTAIAYAHSVGVTLLAASGNMAPLITPVSYPASDPLVISVGSGTAAGQKSEFSQYGSNLDVVAPGGNSSWSGGTSETIWSTWVTSVFEAASSALSAGDHTYMSAEGTSMACPQAAGVCALILSQNPSLTNIEVKDILNSSATDIGSPGFDNETGHGMINAYNAVLGAGITENGARPEENEIIALPNPFNATCKILAKGNITIFDISGREVKNLGTIDGTSTWDGTDDSGESLPSGIYLIRAISGEKSFVAQAMLIK